MSKDLERISDWKKLSLLVRLRAFHKPTEKLLSSHAFDCEFVSKPSSVESP